MPDDEVDVDEECAVLDLHSEEYWLAFNQAWWHRMREKSNESTGVQPEES